MSSESPFSNKTYRRLFAAQIASLIGTGVTTIALSLLAWNLAGNQAGKVLGIALALKMVTYVFLAPLITSFAHKLPRRLWLVSLDVVRLVLVLYLPFVTTVWEIYIVIFLLNSCSAGFTPVFQATIPDILPEKESYQKALSYSQLAYSLEQLISPGLAAFFLTFMSYNGLFVLDGVTFFLSAILVLSTQIPGGKKVERNDSLLYNLRFGISSYLKTPRLRAVWAMYFAVASASAMVIVNTVIYVKDTLGGGEREIALAMGISGIGAIIAALLLPKILTHWDVRKVLLSGTTLLTSPYSSA